MWIWREQYDALYQEVVTLRNTKYWLEREADRADNENRRANKQAENERFRAENAIDELLKIKVQADPVSPGNYMRQQANPAQMDNVFEEEDEEAVKRLMERAKETGMQTIYSEALEEQNEQG